MADSPIPKVHSHDGLELPAIGFGTYKLKGREGTDAIARAIGNGYSLLDSAFNYENEGTVGQAVRAAGRERAGLTITSKLPGRHHEYAAAMQTIEESVFRTGIGYIDLYLVHWPNPKQGKFVDAWRALIDARERGLVGAIGVSNFLPEHIETLERETGVRPAVNQIELHPHFPQEDMVAFHRENGIITQAWSPIGRANEILSEPVIGEIAEKKGKDPAAIVLAWDVARRVVPLPKASSDEHQLSNLAAGSIELSDDEIAAITALGRLDGRIKGQDPETYEEF
ncbi:aldo/keto reductase [Dietzia sp.]|uniref:aldo/keto reductase n=1 Tax=Dietzia sp. TaxID=1871616 RepID=UPI002FD8D41B